MNLTNFRIRFPEFVNASNALIQATLDEAALELDSVVFDTKYDAAHGLLAAHKLALSPYGQGARLAAYTKKGIVTSTYQHHFELLVMQVQGGWARLA